MRLVWTDPAEEDMWGIVEFIAADNPDAALTMQERFHAAAESLLDFPYEGTPGRAPGTRERLLLLPICWFTEWTRNAFAFCGCFMQPGIIPHGFAVEGREW